MSEIQNGGGGSSLFGSFPQTFPFLFYDGSPYLFGVAVGEQVPPTQLGWCFKVVLRMFLECFMPI